MKTKKIKLLGQEVTLERDDKNGEVFLDSGETITTLSIHGAVDLGCFLLGLPPADLAVSLFLFNNYLDAQEKMREEAAFEGLDTSVAN
ncbi:MAG: hypothetical protein JKY94_16645 [Rhodobacteraceae bacterium]|nr:hypothetical protein [Paracoccaceae bacterium]